MNETVQNLVQAIRAGDALETENAFTLAMQEKLSAKLDDMRQSVAQGMFNQEVVTEETEGMTDKHAKQAAKEIAKSHKHLKVTSDDGQHFVHHKNDEDGNNPDIQIHAEGGKIHLNQDHGGGTGHESSSHSDVASAVAHAHKHLVRNIPTEA